MSDNIVTYILGLKDEMSPKLDEATNHVKKMEGAFEGLKETVAHTVESLGISFAIFKGMEFVGEAREYVEKLDKAEANLANTMQNMGNYSKESFEKATGAADALYHKTGFAKDEILGLQAQLGLLGNVSEEEMGRIEKVSADFAAKFGGGIQEAGNMLAKAINNPEMARRLGMQLKIDPAIMEHIQNLAKHGKEAQARLELLKIAEEKVGGAAEAMFNADPLARFNVAMTDVKELVGKAAISATELLAPALESITDYMKDAINVAVESKKWIEEHSGLFLALKDGAIAAAVAFGVFKAIEIGQIAVTKSLVLWEAIQLASINKLGDGYLTASKSMIAFSGIMETVELAIEANPIGAVILAIGALTAGFMALTNNISAATEANDKFKKSILGLVQDAKAEGAKEVYDIADRFEQGIKGFDKTGKAIKYTIDEKNKGIKEAIDAQIRLVEESHTVLKNGIPILDLGFAGQQQIDQLRNYKSLIANRGKDGGTKKSTTGDAIADPKTKAEGQKNVNIHIAINGGLIHGDFKIVTNKLGEGLGKVKDMVAEALTGAINDSQIISTN